MMRIIPTMMRVERHDDAAKRHDDEMLNRVPPLVPPPGGADGPVVDARASATA